MAVYCSISIDAHSWYKWSYSKNTIPSVSLGRKTKNSQKSHTCPLLFKGWKTHTVLWNHNFRGPISNGCNIAIKNNYCVCASSCRCPLVNWWGLCLLNVESRKSFQEEIFFRNHVRIRTRMTNEKGCEFRHKLLSFEIGKGREFNIGQCAKSAVPACPEVSERKR